MYLVERRGTGVPVVCLHGFCQSSAYWEPTLDRLSESGRAAAAPDLPGFGGSADQPGPYTMEGYADAVARMLDAQGISRVVLVGGSMGGVVAQHLVLRHPDRFERLLLVATGAFTIDPVTALAKADSLASGPWNAATAGPIVAGFFHQPQSGGRQEMAVRIAMGASQPAAVEAARSNAVSNTVDRLGRIAVPVMIIQGHHDTSRTPEHAAAMQKQIADCHVAVLPNSGNTPQLEEPDAFHDLALPFLTAEGAGIHSAPLATP
jgi:pimeloyl-ACP methyl ester carboxylesterase